jgi:hypothetical protein
MTKTKLYGALIVLVLVFATSMSFISLGVYELQWWWSVVGVGILVVFAAAMGLVVKKARADIADSDQKMVKSLLQMVGSIYAGLFLTMAMVTWALGNRVLSDSTAYGILGLLIFLALLGVGIQGVLVTIAMFSKVYADTDKAKRHALAE